MGIARSRSTANLLQKIVDAVNSFYAAGDALEEAVDHPEGYKTIATTPELHLATGVVGVRFPFIRLVWG